MSAIPSAHPVPVIPSEDPVYPLSVEQYHAMIAVGVITENDPVELLEGVLVSKIPKNPPHTYAMESAQEMIRPMLPSGWFYRAQEPITLEDGEPEPDGAVVRGSRADFRSRHPGPADAALFIEVADSTLGLDRGRKLRSYARAGIASYWIINLVDRCIEVYSRPDCSGAEPTYLNRDVRSDADSVSLIIDGTTMGTISVRDLLP